MGYNFSFALEALKAGKRVSRYGWNGKGMYAVYQKGYPEGIPVNKNTAESHHVPEGLIMKFRPYFQLFTAQSDVAMWTPSTSDILATDWIILD